MFDAASDVGFHVDIDVYSDVVCPWCYIGKRRLEEALEGFDGEVNVGSAEAYALGIQSVPTFVFAGKYAVSGAQDPGTLRATLEEVARRESAASALQPIGATGPSCDDESCAV